MRLYAKVPIRRGSTALVGDLGKVWVSLTIHDDRTSQEVTNECQGETVVLVPANDDESKQQLMYVEQAYGCKSFLMKL